MVCSLSSRPFSSLPWLHSLYSFSRSTFTLSMLGHSQTALSNLLFFFHASKHSVLTPVKTLIINVRFVYLPPNLWKLPQHLLYWKIEDIKKRKMAEKGDKEVSHFVQWKINIFHILTCLKQGCLLQPFFLLQSNSKCKHDVVIACTCMILVILSTIPKWLQTYLKPILPRNTSHGCCLKTFVVTFCSSRKDQHQNLQNLCQQLGRKSQRPQ